MIIKKIISVTICVCVTALCAFSCSSDDGSSTQIDMTADHTVSSLAVLKSIPPAVIKQAKSDLHIAYGHTSHGSQITSGLTGLVAFMNGLGYENNLYSGLDLNEPFEGKDLGNPAWAQATRDYLNAHHSINVIVWSWCGQVSDATQAEIDTYFSFMEGLEAEFPHVNFVYMTGHLDGTGLTGNLHLRNEQIREYCRSKNKILFDFADIETYDPDGVYFGNLKPTDGCAYTDNGEERNWAIEWQGSHDEDTDWYECYSAHSEPLNANMKAYAFWWMLARLAGWSG